MWILVSFLLLFFLIPGFLGWGFFSGELVSGTKSNFSQKSSNAVGAISIQNLIFKESSNSNLPVRLSIPKLRVNAALEYVGLTTHGAMDVPKGKSNVGWFQLGPRPGEIGSAVIDGHYGVWKNGKVSVFNNLHKLRKGDTLSIKDEKGAIITFIVRESRIYSQYEDASDVFDSNDGKAHLNLITCQGAWNKVKKNYLNRLVVFTDRK